MQIASSICIRLRKAVKRHKTPTGKAVRRLVLQAERCQSTVVFSPLFPYTHHSFRCAPFVPMSGAASLQPPVHWHADGLSHLQSTFDTPSAYSDIRIVTNADILHSYYRKRPHASTPFISATTLAFTSFRLTPFFFIQCVPHPATCFVKSGVSQPDFRTSLRCSFALPGNQPHWPVWNELPAERYRLLNAICIRLPEAVKRPPRLRPASRQETCLMGRAESAK